MEPTHGLRQDGGGEAGRTTTQRPRPARRLPGRVSNRLAPARHTRAPSPTRSRPRRPSVTRYAIGPKKLFSFNPLFQLVGAMPGSTAMAEMFVRIPPKDLTPGSWRILVRRRRGRAGRPRRGALRPCGCLRFGPRTPARGGWNREPGKPTMHAPHPTPLLSPLHAQMVSKSSDRKAAIYSVRVQTPPINTRLVAAEKEAIRAMATDCCYVEKAAKLGASNLFICAAA